MPANVDTGKSRGVGITANCIEVTAEGGVLSKESAGERDGKKDDDRNRDACIAPLRDLIRVHHIDETHYDDGRNQYLQQHRAWAGCFKSVATTGSTAGQGKPNNSSDGDGGNHPSNHWSNIVFSNRLERRQSYRDGFAAT